MKTKKVLLMLAVFLGLASSVKAQQLTVEYLVKANVNSPSFMAGAGSLMKFVACMQMP